MFSGEYGYATKDLTTLDHKITFRYNGIVLRDGQNGVSIISDGINFTVTIPSTVIANVNASGTFPLTIGIQSINDNSNSMIHQANVTGSNSTTLLQPANKLLGASLTSSGTLL